MHELIDWALKVAPTLASLAAVAMTKSMDVKLLSLELKMRDHFAAKGEIEDLRDRLQILEQRSMRGPR
ncbi:MAG: hypothetical protein SFV51_00100 [Bryobacteraceae bacterium]|nr:hypothetical protein [Bryobacteraceae bacterium]